MNYVILNGKKSTLIKGLLISSLPPISKPLIRTQVEEIDGRDGDIVTKLGYAAYNKQISIGLHGDFNVNDVISYFDTSGTVIFSNEPDKYYHYQIIDQIDFERLIRFRTATVTFHVQPFKYSAVEQLREFDFSNENRMEITSLTGYRYSNGLPIEGSESIVADSYDSNNIEFSVTANAFVELVTNTITLSPNTTYTLNYERNDSDVNQSRTYIYNVSDENAYSINKQLIATGLISVTFTTGSNGKIALGFAVGNASSGGTGECTDISIYAGTVKKEISVQNIGNCLSKPKITVYGSGTVNLYLNGFQIFVISLGTDDAITIDAANMEAYKDGVLRNRSVSGDYENLALSVGKNTLSWSGNLTQIDVTNFSRWI